MPRSFLLLPVVAALLMAACSGSSDDDPEPTSDAGPTASTEDEGPGPGELAPAIRGVDLPTDLVDGKSLGSPDALVTLTMFEDFQCPFCLRFTAQDEPMIIGEYVATGQLRIVFRHFPVLRGESIDAAVAAECAAQQDRFWQYHEELFVIQAEAGQDVDEQVNVGRFSEEALRDVAETVGLDLPAYEACVAEPETLAIVQADESAAREAGLRGTPNFVLTIANETAPLPPDGGDIGGPAQWREFLDVLVSVAGTITPVPSPTP